MWVGGGETTASETTGNVTVIYVFINMQTGFTPSGKLGGLFLPYWAVPVRVTRLYPKVSSPAAPLPSTGCLFRLIVVL